MGAEDLYAEAPRRSTRFRTPAGCRGRVPETQAEATADAARKNDLAATALITLRMGGLIAIGVGGLAAIIKL
ncbi:MAG TPA: hypothetical protein VE993_01295 [Stellaceae bacterium]|nr:hypothetical protein [Stellaceae bacterium]